MFEGLASFYEIHLQLKMFPERTRELVQLFGQRTLHQCFFEDVKDVFGGDVWSMNHHVESSEEIAEKFDFISYYKAAAVFKTFHEAIGEETWIKGVRYFLKEMELSPAEPKDLYRSLQKAYDEDNSRSKIVIEELMEAWVKQPGYPIVNVTKLSNGKLKISQQRFPSGDETYAVPINLATAKNSNFSNTSAMFWLTNKSIEIDFDDDWIILNIQQTGYYFVNYDGSLMNDIISQLNRDHTKIHYLNRQALFVHVLHSASQLFVSIGTGFKLMTYLSHERDDNVWDDADAFIRNIYDRFETLV